MHAVAIGGDDVISLVRTVSFLGQAWAEGKGELATCRHRADSGWEKWTKCTPP